MTVWAREGSGLYSKGSSVPGRLRKVLTSKAVTLSQPALPQWPGLSQHFQVGAESCGQASKLSCLPQLS